MATEDSENQNHEVADGEALEEPSAGTHSTSVKRGFFTMTLPVVASVLAGAALGGGAFTFDYAEGTSYLSSESETCANCHIMQDHYDAWNKSTHHNVAKAPAVTLRFNLPSNGRRYL